MTHSSPTRRFSDLAAIADRHSRGLFSDLTMDECLKRHRKAIDDGLLKIISKMGIAVISSYRGGYNFEAVGLSRALVNDLLDRKSTRLNSSHQCASRMPSSACKTQKKK